MRSHRASFNAGRPLQDNEIGSSYDWNGSEGYDGKSYKRGPMTIPWVGASDSPTLGSVTRSATTSGGGPRNRPYDFFDGQ